MICDCLGVFSKFLAERVEFLLREECSIFLDNLSVHSKEGIFSGPSSGGTTYVALEIAKKAKDALIVSIICDRGDRYISTGIFNK